MHDLALPGGGGVGGVGGQHLQPAGQRRAPNTPAADSFRKSRRVVLGAGRGEHGHRLRVWVRFEFRAWRRHRERQLGGSRRPARPGTSESPDQRELAAVQQRPQDVAVGRRSGCRPSRRTRSVVFASSAVGRRDERRQVQLLDRLGRLRRLRPISVRTAAGLPTMPASSSAAAPAGCRPRTRSVLAVLGPGEEEVARTGRARPAGRPSRPPRRGRAVGPPAAPPVTAIERCRTAAPGVSTFTAMLAEQLRRRPRSRPSACSSAGTPSLLQIARIRCFRSNPLAGELARRASSSSSGCDGVVRSCMSSTGLTNPRPKSCAQVRLTIALAKNGFVAAGQPLGQHRPVRLGRVELRPTSPSPRNFAGTVLADFGQR